MYKSVLVAAALMLSATARADWISEIGAGIKYPATTSVLLLEDCHVARIIQTKPDRPDLNYRYASCGGDDPMFIGWPIAWERDIGDMFKVRAGWFHLSHWFDGRSDRELHLDCACATFTLNWSDRARKRGKK